jgi:hypothetical protein
VERENEWGRVGERGVEVDAGDGENTMVGEGAKEEEKGPVDNDESEVVDGSNLGKDSKEGSRVEVGRKVERVGPRGMGESRAPRSEESSRGGEGEETAEGEVEEDVESSKAGRTGTIDGNGEKGK